MYHRIADDAFDPWGLAVPRHTFADQIQWLAKNRTVLDLAELARLHAAGSLPRDAVAITFDDGYASVAREALPIIERFGLKATIFIPASLVERQAEFWWDELSRSIINFRGDRLLADGLTFELGAREPDDHVWPPGAEPATRRQKALHEIWSRIRTRPLDEIEQVLGEVRDQTGADRSSPGDRLMSTGAVREASSDVSIGSHAMTHASLPMLKQNERAAEIRSSISACEAMAGSRPECFAYPFGEYDDETERLVKAAGFVCACTSDHGPVTAEARLMALPRVGVGNWALPLFKRVLLEL